MISKTYKEIGRYLIIVVLMVFTWQLSLNAYELEKEGKLTLQFAGVVGSSWGALTMVLKFIFQSKVDNGN